MRLSLFLSLLATLALSSPLEHRQIVLPTGQTVKQDVINIHNAVLELDATVQAYQGTPLPTSIVEGTPVLLGVAKIHEVNRAGFRHAVAALPFSVEDSREVIDTVSETGMFASSFSTNPSDACHAPKSSSLATYCDAQILDQTTSKSHPLTPSVNISIPNATKHLEAKAEAFKEGSLTAVVIASLALLLSDHDTFSAATLAKVNPGVGGAKIKEGSDAVANIHNAITHAILFYGGNLV
jgi:hypothetical protein